MDINFKKTAGIQAPASFLAETILQRLQLRQRVLWFATGGSSIDVAVEATKIISNHPHTNLTVALTDERYGNPGHPDSNWQQLVEGGFSLPQAKLIPILSGEAIAVTTEKFGTILAEELAGADFKIGLFGIGADGHTAGILPHSSAVNSPDLAHGYRSEKFERITITPNVISQLDEVIVYMRGQEKWKVLEDLKEKNIGVQEQPAQILKEVPRLTIFSDYQK